MTKITLKPWEEIVIHEVIKHDLKELVKLKTLFLRTGQTADALLWADGIAFVRTLMPPTDDVIRDQLKGIIHFSSVEYAVMPKYRKSIVSGSITVPVIDVSRTPALKDLVKALKKQR